MTEYSKILLTSISIVLARLTTMFSIQDIQHRCQAGKIIEEYPDYWLNPAALVFGCKINGQIIHVVVGMDDFVHIVTAYYPNLEKFEADLKTRRRS